jgi:hypothetical protein
VFFPTHPFIINLIFALFFFPPTLSKTNTISKTFNSLSLSLSPSVYELEFEEGKQEELMV